MDNSLIDSLTAILKDISKDVVIYSLTERLKGSTAYDSTDALDDSHNPVDDIQGNSTATKSTYSSLGLSFPNSLILPTVGLEITQYEDGSRSGTINKCINSFILR